MGVTLAVYTGRFFGGPWRAEARLGYGRGGPGGRPSVFPMVPVEPVHPTWRALASKTPSPCEDPGGRPAIAEVNASGVALPLPK
jgi:hypothetical protein